jgi:Brp/Blh family beta-carotene 15,15'-monooxygenase
MTLRAPAVGWSVMLLAGLAAAAGPLAVQLGFAVLAVGVIGLAHGASDLAIVDRSRRPAFLGLYGLVAALCLIWWMAAPAVALPAFLLASALHFALEDAPADRPFERIARGTSLVATPATLHAPALAAILHLAGLSDRVAPPVVLLLAMAGGAAAAALLGWGIVRRDTRLLVGTGALLVLPPLVGFSLGFLILHAAPQTSERRVRLGCATLTDYLRRVWPILGAAAIIVAGVGALVLRWDPSGVRSLFAGIAALAMPHLLVTPWFERSGVRSLKRHPVRIARLSRLVS